MSEVRFWNNVDKREIENDCWLWKLSCRNGYGRAWFQGKSIGTHRLAFELFNKRPIAEGLSILHSCDNKKCCRPSHLSEGTHQENMDDKVSKDRQIKGEIHGRSKLKVEQVLEIREKYSNGGVSYIKLAIEYNVCETTISNIIHRRIWVHI